MEQRRLYALLLSGQRPDHIDNILLLQNYLVQEVSLLPSRIRLVPNSSDPTFVLKEIEDFFQNLPKEVISDVLVAYSGYGGRGKLAPNGHVMDYKDLGRQIANNGDFIFLNDCCYSASCVDAFIERGLLPNRGMVLASSKKDNIQLGGGFEDVIETYRQRKPYTAIKVVKVKMEDYNEEAKDTYIFTIEGGKTKILVDPAQRFVNGSSIEKIVALEGSKRFGKNLDHLLFPK